MAESLGGALDLGKLKLTGGIVPMRFWQELSQLRRARLEEKRLETDKSRLKVDEKKKDLKRYIKDHDDGLKHAVNAVAILYQLARNCAYDILAMKGIIHDMLREDRELGKQGIRADIEHKLEKGDVQALQQINGSLRRGSDLWGALTKE